MIYDERLIGRKPSDEQIEKSKVRLESIFKQRFEQRAALRREHQVFIDARYGLLRGLGKKHPALATAVESAKARSAALAERLPHRPELVKVRPRVKQGTVAVTFVPPFWDWQSYATTGGSGAKPPRADVSANGNNGTMSFNAETSDDGDSASSTAVSLGYYFCPLGDNSIMEVSAAPSFNYWWFCTNVLDSSHSGAYIGLEIDEYTLDDVFTRTVINQQISLWDSGDGQGRGGTSGYPLQAVTPVDNNHYYVFWVNAVGDAEGDGFNHPFWGSGALSSANLAVSSISVANY